MNENEFKDDLDIIFERQKKFQKLLNNDTTTQQYFENQMICLYQELSEITNCTKFKNWKKNQEYKQSEMQEEIIDAFHFLINIAIFADMSPGLFMLKFIEKNQKNFKRQCEGY